MNFHNVNERNGSTLWIGLIVFGEKNAVLNDQKISQGQSAGLPRANFYGFATNRDVFAVRGND
jgi:hypothetical protein